MVIDEEYDFDTEAPPVADQDRDYQIECIEAVERAWGECSRALIVMATGGGKTRIFSRIAQKEIARGGRVLILAHTEELIEQAQDKLFKATGLASDKEKADLHASPLSPVVVGSIQTFCRLSRLQAYPDNHFTLVVADECFPEGTKIDGHCISTWNVGDFVASYNHKECAIEHRKITGLFRKKYHGPLIRITFSDGTKTICTPEHPFFSDGRYRKASDLTEDCNCVHYKYVRVMSSTCGSCIPAQRTVEIMVPEVQGEAPDRKEDNEKIVLQNVQKERCMFGDKTQLYEPSGYKRKTGLLQHPMQGSVAQNLLDRRKQFSEVQSHFWSGKDAQKKSDVQTGERRQNGSLPERKDFSCSRRKRDCYQAADSITRCVGSRLEDGISYNSYFSETSIRVASESLQSGFSVSRSEPGHRSRWENSRTCEMEIFRPEENVGLKNIRVDCVEILEPGDRRRPSEMRFNCWVFNLEVDGNNNYFANGILVHNCHRSLAPSWQRVLRYFHFGAQSLDENWLMPEPGVPYEPKARILGVTATADRGDKRTLGEFFQKVAYEWGLLEACRDGYLVRPIVRNIPPEKGTELDLRGIKLSRISGQADFDVAEVSNRITPYLAGMAKSIALHAKDRKTVCFLPSIETARIMSLMLSHHGLNASFVSGACPDRTEKIAAFHEAGNGSAIANAMLLTEGWDSPEVSCICVLRPTKIRALLSQCIGRGTRTWPGVIDGLGTPQERLAAIDASPKRDLLILDFLWLTDRLDLVKPIDLIASKPEIRKLMEESGESDLLVAEASAQRDLLKALEKAAKKNSKKKERVIDPLAWAVSLGDTALAGWEPESKWDELPPTPGQIELLAKQGIDTKNLSARGLASKIIDRLLSRMKLKLCTPKQLTLLLQFGYDEHKVALMTIDQASGVIGRAIASRR